MAANIAGMPAATGGHRGPATVPAAGNITPPDRRTRGATAPMETTPTLRARQAGQGLTPDAKRPMDRVITDEEDTTVMSIAEMSQILSSVKRQYEQDMIWIADIDRSVSNHADIINRHTATISDTAAQLVGTRGVVAKNDQETKDAIRENDANLKNIIQDNDTTSKKIIDDNDVNTKNELRTNDLNLKENLRLSDGKIQVALEGTKALKGMFETSSSEFQRLEATVNMLGQISGDGTAVQRAAEQYTAAMSMLHQSQAEQRAQQLAIDQITNAYTVLEGRLSAMPTGASSGPAPAPHAAFAYAQAAAAASATLRPDRGVDAMQHPGGDPWNQGQSPGVGAMPAPPGLGDDGRPQRLRVFEEKVALLPARMYQDRDPIGWKNMTRNYWVGRHKGMKNFLEWIEG